MGLVTNKRAVQYLGACSRARFRGCKSWKSLRPLLGLDISHACWASLQALLGVSGTRGPSKSTGKSERNRRVRLRVALDDVTFALQGSRFFRHLLVDELTRL